MFPCLCLLESENRVSFVHTSAQNSSHVSWYDWIYCFVRSVQLQSGNLLMSTIVVDQMIASDVFL